MQNSLQARSFRIIRLFSEKDHWLSSTIIDDRRYCKTRPCAFSAYVRVALVDRGVPYELTAIRVIIEWSSRSFWSEVYRTLCGRWMMPASKRVPISSMRANERLRNKHVPILLTSKNF